MAASIDHSQEEKARRDNFLRTLEKLEGKITVYDAASGLAREFQTEIGCLYVDGKSLVVRVESGEQFVSDFNSTMFTKENEPDFLVKRYFGRYPSLKPLVCMKTSGSCPKQEYKDYKSKIVVKELVVSDGLCGRLNRPLRVCDDLENTGLILYIQK